MLRRFRGSGYEKTQSGLRFLRFFPPHFFCASKKCSAFFLIGRKKTSVTAGTLGDIDDKNEKIIC